MPDSSHKIARTICDDEYVNFTNSADHKSSRFVYYVRHQFADNKERRILPADAPIEQFIKYLNEHEIFKNRGIKCDKVGEYEMTYRQPMDIHRDAIVFTQPVEVVRAALADIFKIELQPITPPDGSERTKNNPGNRKGGM